jgi:hypothetical protein
MFPCWFKKTVKVYWEVGLGAGGVGVVIIFPCPSVVTVRGDWGNWGDCGGVGDGLAVVGGSVGDSAVDCREGAGGVPLSIGTHELLAISKTRANVITRNVFRISAPPDAKFLSATS